jgi:hypothetical protein
MEMLKSRTQMTWDGVEQAGGTIIQERETLGFPLFANQVLYFQS